MVILLEIRCDDPENTFWSPQELAGQLGCPLSRLTGWRKNGGGPDFVKFGKSVAYQVAAVNTWKEANTFTMTGIRAARDRRRP